ncbi:hypothetical protein Ancab_005253 [Ancistrocladus abbreviatus]
MARARDHRRVLSMEYPGRRRPCLVFINHRGVDMKKTFAGLLEYQLASLGINTFLDRKSMKPGDNLVERIEKGVRECKVGVVVFSPRYCESRSCLRELALMVDCNKKMIPIFWDVEPAELRLNDELFEDQMELQRFNRALRMARRTIGLVFDSRNGDWADFLTRATNAIVEAMMEVEENPNCKHKLFENLALRRTFARQFQSYIKYACDKYWKDI